MGKENERKFLVSSSFFDIERQGDYIRQGYVFKTPNKHLRVRLQGDRAELTIKGKRSGITRPEFPFNINTNDATDILNTMCDGEPIEKIRYTEYNQNNIWTIDKFLGKNEGLLMAEIELANASEDFERPDWLGKEVTNDNRYYNEYLSEHPYRTWKDEV